MPSRGRDERSCISTTRPPNCSAIAKRIDKNRALPAEAIAGKRLSKKTVQAIEVANGEKLAVEQMQELSEYLLGLAMTRYAPVLSW
jgi:hypothetical protein